MANPLFVELRAMGDVSASGSGSSVALNTGLSDARAYRTAGRFTLTVAALTGGIGTVLSVTIETSANGTTAWRPAGTFPMMRGPVRIQQAFAKLDSYVRVSWVLSGGTSPVATFGVDSLGVGGGAHQVYLVPEDITCSALQERVLETVPAHVQADACISASGLLEAALIEGGKVPPFVSLDERVRQAGIALAACRVLKWKGFTPESEADQTLLDECTAAMQLLNAIATGKTDPDVTPPDGGDGSLSGRARIFSQPARGW